MATITYMDGTINKVQVKYESGLWWFYKGWFQLTRNLGLIRLGILFLEYIGGLKFRMKMTQGYGNRVEHTRLSTDDFVEYCWYPNITEAIKNTPLVSFFYFLLIRYYLW